MTPYGKPNTLYNPRLSSNEGPEQLINPTTGQNFVIYSAARSDNRNYCLGMLELVGDDPMNVQDWRKNNEGCVFYQNALVNVSVVSSTSFPWTRDSLLKSVRWKAYGVGHASFTTSPDGSQNWIVYHGMENPFAGWNARTIRTQQFTWNSDGSPNFPRPGYGPFAIPAGQSWYQVDNLSPLKMWQNPMMGGLFNM